MGDETSLRALLLDAGVVQDLASKLGAYGARLLEANRRFNLTGAGSPEELSAHLLDSLTVVPYISGPFVDVGSGGGLPAIPAALATGAEVALVESTGKKAAFLRDILDEFSIAGRVVAERAEVAAHDPGLRGRFASGTARAVSTAPTVLELLAPFLGFRGTLVVQRGRMDDRERRAVMDAAPMLGSRFIREVSLEGDRRILLFEQETLTPQRFPRRTGIPEKRPLCY